MTVAVLVLMAVTSVDCGYILYPWRRGNRPGEIDGETLVMDILWFIPGFIPGAIALAVDFSTGAIYTGRRGRRIEWRRDKRRHTTTIRIDSFYVRPGDRLGLNVNLATPPAPGSEVSVTLAPKSAEHHAAIPYDTWYTKADGNGNMAVLTLPRGLAPGEYRASVSVNGVESNVVDLMVVL